MQEGAPELSCIDGLQIWISEPGARSLKTLEDSGLKSQMLDTLHNEDVERVEALLTALGDVSREGWPPYLHDLQDWMLISR